MYVIRVCILQTASMKERRNTTYMYMDGEVQYKH